MRGKLASRQRSLSSLEWPQSWRLHRRQEGGAQGRGAGDRVRGIAVAVLLDTRTAEAIVRAYPARRSLSRASDARTLRTSRHRDVAEAQAGAGPSSRSKRSSVGTPVVRRMEPPEPAGRRCCLTPVGATASSSLLSRDSDRGGEQRAAWDCLRTCRAKTESSTLPEIRERGNDAPTSSQIRPSERRGRRPAVYVSSRSLSSAQFGDCRRSRPSSRRGWRNRGFALILVRHRCDRVARQERSSGLGVTCTFPRASSLGAHRSEPAIGKLDAEVVFTLRRVSHGSATRAEV